MGQHCNKDRLDAYDHSVFFVFYNAPSYRKNFVKRCLHYATECGICSFLLENRTAVSISSDLNQSIKGFCADASRPSLYLVAKNTPAAFTKAKACFLFLFSPARHVTIPVPWV